MYFHAFKVRENWKLGNTGNESAEIRRGGSGGAGRAGMGKIYPF
jgi:hypothetical protein